MLRPALPDSHRRLAHDRNTPTWTERVHNQGNVCRLQCLSISTWGWSLLGNCHERASGWGGYSTQQSFLSIFHWSGHMNTFREKKNQLRKGEAIWFPGLPRSHLSPAPTPCPPINPSHVHPSLYKTSLCTNATCLLYKSWTWYSFLCRCAGHRWGYCDCGPRVSRASNGWSSRGTSWLGHTSSATQPAADCQTCTSQSLSQPSGRWEGC